MNLSGRLIEAGLTNFYSPVAELHPIAEYNGLDPYSDTIWVPFYMPKLSAADAILVGKLPGWERSAGVQHEVEEGLGRKKALLYIDPITMKVIQTA